jgi:signal transduction histidine kinase
MEKTARANVLLVDDKDEGLLALETVLKEDDYNLVKAHSGREALSLLLKDSFSVILMDVKMPEMDGFETAHFIKKRDKTKGIPIIFVSGAEKDEKFIAHGYESGAVDYLFKPFDPQVLRSKVSVFVDLMEQTHKIKIQSDQLAEIQRKEQQRQLELLEFQSRVRYKNLADAIPHIVWKAGADQTADYFNRTWVNYTGLSSEQSFGSGWKAAFHANDLPGFISSWKEASQVQSDFEMEVRIYNKKLQDYRWHLLKAVPDKTEEDRIVSWLLSCTEIHTLKEYEAQLIEAKKEADAANRAKSFFLANMSHEIRTPLGAIMGFSDLLLQEETDIHDVSEYAHTIKRSGEQLLKIIDEILDISKVESGSLRVVREKIDLRELVGSVQSYLKIQAAKKNLQLRFELDGPVPERFFSDATRVKQILTNIIGNAVKFSSGGEVNVFISSLKVEGDLKVLFKVEDQGPGIDEKYLEAIFKPFSQGDSSTSRKYGGTGLGLALSRKLAKALGGDVELLRSEKGRGSAFQITLSAQVKGEVEMINSLKERKKVSQDGRSLRQKEIKTVLRGVKVLVADDAEENQRLITWFLEKAGAQVEHAYDGREAVDKALHGTQDLVLMDIQMPEVDGYQATRELRRKGYSRPIIAVTAHALVEERMRCFDAGCTDYLSKPINVQKLLSLVSKHTSGPVLPTVSKEKGSWS